MSNISNNDKSYLILISFLILFVLITFILEFYTSFIEEFFVDPILADAGESTSSHPGYNLYSTIGYSILLASAVYVIYKWMEREGINYDGKYLFATIPYIILGSLWRVLEDSWLFRYPGNVYFIAPVIYVVVGLLAIFYLFISYVSRNRPLLSLSVGMAFFIVLPLLLFSDSRVSYHFYIPLVVAVPVVYLYFKNVFSGEGIHFPNGYLLKIDTSVWRFFVFGIGWILLTLYFYFRWMIHTWSDNVSGREWTFPAIISIAILITLVYYIVSRIYYSRIKDSLDGGSWISNIRKPSDIMMIFAQYLDGTATFFGIQFFSYSEKHVLPGFMMSNTGSAWVMFMLKTIVIILILYLIEGPYRTELEKHPVLLNILKLAVIVLGLATGTRDCLRISMGV